MRQFFLFLSTILLFVSCNDITRPKKPKNLLSEKEMVSVLVDLSLISSAKGVNRQKLENNGISPKDFVYNKHSIDSLQFALSNEYYAYNADDYKVILNQVSDSLDKLKTIYQKLADKEQAEKHKRDSLIRQKRKDSIRLLKKKQ